MRPFFSSAPPARRAVRSSSQDGPVGLPADESGPKQRILDQFADGLNRAPALVCHSKQSCLCFSPKLRALVPKLHR